MAENKAKTYSLLIKIGIAVVIGILTIILIWQYANLTNLNRQNDQLQQEYSALVAEHNNISSKKEEVESNYDQYVADYVRDNFDYTQKDEILINKQ